MFTQPTVFTSVSMNADTFDGATERALGGLPQVRQTMRERLALRMPSFTETRRSDRRRRSSGDEEELSWVERTEDLLTELELIAQYDTYGHVYKLRGEEFSWDDFGAR